MKAGLDYIANNDILGFGMEEWYQLLICPNWNQNIELIENDAKSLKSNQILRNL